MTTENLSDQELEEKIDRILTLFETRDSSYQESTAKIVEAVKYPIAVGVGFMLGIDVDLVHIVDVQIMDGRLLSTILVDPENKSRLFRTSLPVEILAASAEEVSDYLHKAMDMQHQETQAVSKDAIEKKRNVGEFDYDELSKDQINQFLYFQHLTLKNKH